jgi:hypothetical protein
VCLAASLALACAATPAASDSSSTSAATPASEVEPTAHTSPEPHGPGWRVRDGVLETVHEGVRVRPPVGWQLVLNDLNPLFAGNSSFVLHHDDGVDLGLFVPLFEDDKRWIEMARAPGESSAKPTVAFTSRFAGRELAFEQFYAKDGSRVLIAPIEIDGRTLEVAVMSHPDLRISALSQRTDDALTGIELLSTAERDRLRAELADVPPDHDLLGKAWSLRGDRFRHFEHGVELQLPRGVWLVSWKSEESAEELILTNPNENLRVQIDLVPHETPELSSAELLEGLHEGTVDLYVADGLKRTKSERRELGSMMVLLDRLEFEALPRRLHLASLIHGSVWISILVRSRLGPQRPDDAQVEALIDELLANFVLGPSQAPIEQIGRRFVDRRSGFSLEAPTEDQPEFGELQRGYTAAWPGGRALISVVNAASSNQRGDALRDFMVEKMVAEMTSPKRVQLPSRERLVSGLPARWLLWQDQGGSEVHCLIFVRGCTVFSITVIGDLRTANQIFDSFELID